MKGLGSGSWDLTLIQFLPLIPKRNSQDWDAFTQQGLLENEDGEVMHAEAHSRVIHEKNTRTHITYAYVTHANTQSCAYLRACVEHACMHECVCACVQMPSTFEEGSNACS